MILQDAKLFAGVLFATSGTLLVAVTPSEAGEPVRPVHLVFTCGAQAPGMHEGMFVVALSHCPKGEEHCIRNHCACGGPGQPVCCDGTCVVICTPTGQCCEDEI